MRFSGAGLSALFIGTALERGKKLLAGGGCRIFIRDHEIARGLLVQLDRVFDGDGGARRTILQRGKNVLGQGAQRVEALRSEEHTSELQSLMRISYAVFCLKKKTN